MSNTREDVLIEKVEHLLNQCKRRAFSEIEMYQTLIKLGKDFSLFSNLEPFKSENKIKVKDFLKQQEVVYFLYFGSMLVYIGRTANLSSRIHAHITDGKKFDSFAFFECDDSEGMVHYSDLELFLLEFYKTKYNGTPFQKKV